MLNELQTVTVLTVALTVVCIVLAGVGWLARRMENSNESL